METWAHLWVPDDWRKHLRPNYGIQIILVENSSWISRQKFKMAAWHWSLLLLAIIGYWVGEKFKAWMGLSETKRIMGGLPRWSTLIIGSAVWISEDSDQYNWCMGSGEWDKIPMLPQTLIPFTNPIKIKELLHNHDGLVFYRWNFVIQTSKYSLFCFMYLFMFCYLCVQYPLWIVLRKW